MSSLNYELIAYYYYTKNKRSYGNLKVYSELNKDETNYV